jgi:hypothetical protein
LAAHPAGASVSGVKNPSDLLQRVLLRDDLFSTLLPREPLARDLVRRIREAGDATLAGEGKIASPAHLALFRGGLLYAADALDECHRIFQEDHSDLGSYWHGMMHRREGDFDNARYWFRRAGELPIAAALHTEAARVSPLMARQTTWDAYLLTGECEQAAHGAEEGRAECLALLRVEFDGLLDYCWRKATGS